MLSNGWSISFFGKECFGQYKQPVWVLGGCFECCVARYVWQVVCVLLRQNMGDNFESIGRFGVAKRHKLMNVISSSVLWSFWKRRNEMCFQVVTWTSMRRVLMRIARLVRRWLPLLNPNAGLHVEEFPQQLEARASLTPQLQWMPDVTSISSGLEL